MSLEPQRKIRGGQSSELAKMKILWRDTLSEDAKSFWLTRMESQDPQKLVRAEIQTKLKVNLRFDRQLTTFRQWAEEQEARDEEAQRMADDERRTMLEHPEWTKEQVREDILRQAYFRAHSDGDFKLGLKTMAADAKLEALQFDKERFKEGLRSKLEAGLAELATHIKGNAAAQEAYEKFRATVQEETK